ncbi:DUF7344 domain-containing protein [Halobellus rufus]|uniref:DUF7344 domain-containing protein n=1 Tax=Halobellus rufus TaxID=1448860 RepID=UPI000678CA34|nr:hypothetical protein [Halobellus rufus]
MNSGGQVSKVGHSGDDDEPSNDEALSTDTIFETLSNRRRRYILHYLTQVDDPVTIRDLSRQIAAWENQIDARDVTPKQRKRVYTALHQTHLPTMDRLGVVVYDRDRGTVAMTDHVKAFDIYLDVVPKDDIPWSQFYLVLGSVLSALVVVAALGFPPFSYVGGFGYALFVAGTLTVASCVHVLRDRRSLIGTTAVPPEIEPPREIADEL